MSEMANPQKGITRRGFLKTAGATAGVVGLAGISGMTSTEDWLAPAKAHAEESNEKLAYTFHYRHCQCNCHLKCTVRDGRMVHIEPNKWPDKRNETICVKGISEIQHTYSKERLQTPLKRVGERGEGKFQQISWDEALDTIAEKVKEINSKYGDGSICTMPSVDTLSQNLTKLVKAQEKPSGGIDMGLGNGFSPAIAESGGQGAASNEIKDWKNAKTILNVGCNVLETCMVTAPYFFDAKEAGAEIISIDPNYCTTAAKSSRWIPIEPGTDAALYLGMMRHITDNNWHDAEYLRDKTSMPFLVDTSNGKLLRVSEEDKGADGKAISGKDNPFLVWDSKTDSLKEYNDGSVVPELDKSVSIDGKEYRTVYSLFLDHLQKYDLDWASEKTGIPKETIEELAQKYACNGPSILSFGFGGADKFANSDVSGHAAVVLATLVGSFGTNIPGRGAGAYVNAYQKGFGFVNPPAWKLPSELKASKAPKGTQDMRDEKSGIHMIWLQDGAFQQRLADQGKTDEWAKSLDFIVAQEIWHTPSVDWADIVLPVCSHFETEENIGVLRAFRGHALLQQKVIEPLFESHSDFWIENEIAKRLGYGDAMPKSLEELVKYQLETTDNKALKGITLDELLKNNGVVALKNQPEIGRNNTDGTFKTTSGRIDLYYQDRLDFGQQLPTYEEPNEAYADNPLRKKYPLQFFQRRTKYHLHQNNVDSTWIQQFYHPSVEMNPKDAEARGLKDNDIIEVFNDRGSFKTKCSVSNAIRPGTVAIVEGIWQKYMDEGTLQNVTNDTIIDRSKILPKGRVIPFNDTLVEIKRA